MTPIRIRLSRRAEDGTAAAASATAARSSAGVDYYGGVVVGAQTIGAFALEESTHNDVNAVLTRLEPRRIREVIREYVQEGRRLAGQHVAIRRHRDRARGRRALLEPRQRYLEVGVRRGRSMAIVAAGATEAEVIGVDLWVPDYAGMENPGPDFVPGQLECGRFQGGAGTDLRRQSEILPRLFAARRELAFDLITVDGDHSRPGARRDLRDVLPRLRVGGAIVFDDIAHQLHPELVHKCRAARRVIGATRRGSSTTSAYGVAVAVRRW